VALRVDLIGRCPCSPTMPAPLDAGRRRVARRAPARGRGHADRAIADELAREVTALYTCGRRRRRRAHTVRARLDTLSAFVPREAVRPRYEMVS
jgi:hypothetical protein